MIGHCPRAVLYPAGSWLLIVQPLKRAPCLGAASTLWQGPRQTLLWSAVACATPGSQSWVQGIAVTLRWGQHIRVSGAVLLYTSPLPKIHPPAAALRRALSLAASAPFPPT